MMIFQEPDYLGLFLVISGGQCGADEAGLAAAHDMNVATGGVAPAGFLTYFGPKPILGEKYGLVEHASAKYAPRTQENVRASHGTLIIASNPGSPGCRLTAETARKLGRPCKLVQLEEDYTNQWLMDQAREITSWLIENRISVLNVAGNRDKFGNLHYHATHKLLSWVFMNLQQRNLLHQKALQ